jgi:outer membrane protein TolC
MKGFRKNIFIHFVTLIVMLFASEGLNALTLEEAIALAKENLPSYKASLIKVRSTEALYDASLSPYLPNLDFSASYRRHFTTMDDFNSRNYDLSLSYTLFDGGKRKASRNIAKLNLDIDKEESKKSLLDLQFNVKVSFYTVIAQKEILEQRRIQLKDAEKDYEVAEGRYKFGVAKLSDVLQASVRLEQARFNLIQAEGDYKKALSDLNSLIGKDLDSQHELIGSLYSDVSLPERNLLYDLTLKRPEISQAEKALKIAENNKLLNTSTFYPNISLNAIYSKRKDDLRRGDLNFTSTTREETVTSLTLTWNIFELGKFFKQRSLEFEKNVSLENLNEIKRTLLLETYKVYEDLLTNLNKIKVAEEQLKQAEHNYSQALGEYKVGKADILSLIQAESQLSNAREQMVNSKLNFILTKSLLERVLGIESIESLKKPL